MKSIVIMIVLGFITFVSCDDDECPVTNSIIGFWKVESIIEDEIVVERDNPQDTIEISFQPLGIMYGNSYRNELIAHFEIFDKDSIWMSYVGGTDVNYTSLEAAFRSIIPEVSHLEFKTYKDLVLHTTDRKSRISLGKYE